jgi:hypothetical protein
LPELTHPTRRAEGCIWALDGLGIVADAISELGDICPVAAPAYALRLTANLSSDPGALSLNRRITILHKSATVSDVISKSK